MTQYILEATSWLNFNGIFDYFRDLKHKHEMHRNIRSTINELSKLSDKQLRDIGLHRGDIWSVAHEVYYDDRLEANKNLKGWV